MITLKKIQPELDLSIEGDSYIISESHNGRTFNKLTTTDMQEVMKFAELYNWGMLGNRQNFGGYVMHCFAVNQLKEA